MLLQRQEKHSHPSEDGQHVSDSLHQQDGWDGGRKEEKEGGGEKKEKGGVIKVVVVVDFEKRGENSQL